MGYGSASEVSSRQGLGTVRQGGKTEIARRYLIPRQLHATGLTAEQFILTDAALRHVIGRYTREPGVRQLERTIGRLARRVALRVAEGQSAPVTGRVEDVSERLGPERFRVELARQQLPPSVATGLAWTEAGSEMLYIEATLLPEGTGLTLTGQLGAVMQESARAAQSFIWSHAEGLGIDRALFKNAGVHIHVPAGAIPKDGPSAGIRRPSVLKALWPFRQGPMGSWCLSLTMTAAGTVLTTPCAVAHQHLNVLDFVFGAPLQRVFNHLAHPLRLDH